MRRRTALWLAALTAAIVVLMPVGFALMQLPARASTASRVLAPAAASLESVPSRAST